MKLPAERLPEHLAKGLTSCYWVSGEEILVVQEAAQAIRNAAKQAGFSERRVLETENNFDWQQLNLHANNLSLFSQRCLLELHLTSALNESAKKELLRYAEHPPSDKILLIIGPKLEKNQLQTQWFKRLEALMAVISTQRIDATQWPQWLTRRLQQAGLNLDAEGFQWLITRCEGNLLAATQTIEKLILVHGANTNIPINATAIKAALEDNSHFEIFDLLDYALAGEAPKTWHILQRLHQNGIEPTLILWVLLREIRLLMTVAHVSAQRLPLDAVFAQHRVWSARKTLVKNAAQRHSRDQFTLLLQQAAYLDRVIKGAAPGNAWDELATLALQLAGVFHLTQSRYSHDDL